MKRFLIAFTLSWIAYTRTDSFAPWKIEAPVSDLDLSAASDEIKQILSQPFHYLGKGRQSFVFVSSDERYVLKFFNKTYFQMSWFSFLFYEKEKRKKEKRRFFFEKSYEIAFKEFGEEILYLHLGSSTDLFAKQIQGPAHGVFRVDLNRVPFVLQRKGEPFYAGLEKIYAREGTEGLCREIDRFIEQLSRRISKHIADDDSDIEHNWGYVQGRLFHLDPGRLYLDPSLKAPKRQKEEWHRATHHFVEWLQKNYPESAQYFESQLVGRFN